MKTWTQTELVEMLRANTWGKQFYTKKRCREIFGDRKYFTILDVLALDLPDGDVLRLVPIFAKSDPGLFQPWKELLGNRFFVDAEWLVHNAGEKAKWEGEARERRRLVELLENSIKGLLGEVEP